MLNHLAFGFLDKAEAPAVTSRRCKHPKRAGAAKPRPVQPARPCAEFREPPFAPKQVVALFARGLDEIAMGFTIARKQRLAQIQGLGAHFAAVVNAHQAGRVALLNGAETGLGKRLSRVISVLAEVGAGGRTQNRINPRYGEIAGRQISRCSTHLIFPIEASSGGQNLAEIQGFALTPWDSVRTIAPLFSCHLKPSHENLHCDTVHDQT